MRGGEHDILEIFVAITAVGPSGTYGLLLRSRGVDERLTWQDEPGMTRDDPVLGAPYDGPLLCSIPELYVSSRYLLRDLSLRLLSFHIGWE